MEMTKRSMSEQWRRRRDETDRKILLLIHVKFKEGTRLEEREGLR